MLEIALGDFLDLFYVPAQLAVEPGVVIGQPDGGLDAGLEKILDLQCRAKASAQVHHAGYLKADVMFGVRVRFQNLSEIFFSNDFFCGFFPHQFYLGFDVHGRESMHIKL